MFEKLANLGNRSEKSEDRRIYGVAVEISSDQSGAPVVTVCPPEGRP